MKDFSTIPNTAGTFPDVHAVDESAPLEDDGTPLHAQWVNEVWSYLQLTLDNANMTPDGVSSADQFIDALNYKYPRKTHDHAGTYSPAAHNHSGIYSEIAHDHAGVYAVLAHNHAGVYAESGHNHNGVYAYPAHDHAGVYAVLAHNHSGVYSPASHNHDSTYSAAVHNHDSTYSATTHAHLSASQILQGSGDITSPGSGFHFFGLVPDGATATIDPAAYIDGTIFTVKVESWNGNGATVSTGVYEIGDTGQTSYSLSSEWASVSLRWDGESDKFWIVGST